MIDPGLQGKTALTTGGNNPFGIGSAVAIRLAEQGAKVFIHPRCLNRINAGIIVTCTGIIMVLIMTKKSGSLPGKRNLANPYATNVELKRTPRIPIHVTNMVFNRYLLNVSSSASGAHDFA